MEVVASFLSNPVVGGVGYALSIVSSIIAIVQFFEKNKVKKELATLKVTISNKQTNDLNKNKVQQGDKSQYFHGNQGDVKIDNRD